MKLRSIEVVMNIDVYNKKLFINGKEVLQGLEESKQFIFNILDVACVCAIDKARKYLEDNYKGQYVDYVKIEAFEEPVITIFQKA